MTTDDARESSTSEVPLGILPNRTVSGAVPAAAWAFAFLILRVFAVSGYDWDTAFLVSTTLGIDDGLALIFGSFMAEHLAVAVLLILVLPLLVGTYLWAPNGRRAAVVLPMAIGVMLLVALTVSFRSWWVPVVTFTFSGLLELVRRMPSLWWLNRVLAALMARVGLFAGLAVLFVAVLVQTPWVPRERIVTTDGIVIGYVLSVDAGYLNVLTEDQEFVILISGDVISRD